METVEVNIKISCPNEKQHLAVSSMLKTICHTLDVAVETNGSGNDFTYQIKGTHPDAKTEYTGTQGGKRDDLKKAFGL